MEKELKPLKEGEEIYSVGLRADRRGAQVVIHDLGGERGITSRTVHAQFKLFSSSPHRTKRNVVVDVFKMVHRDEDLGLIPIERKVVAEGGA